MNCFTPQGVPTCCKGTFYYIQSTSTDCATGAATTNPTAGDWCSTDPSPPPLPSTLDTNDCGKAGCDGVIGESQPPSCNGSEAVQSGLVDQGCGDDENKCADNDRDPFPVRFSSGRVESRPLTLINLPSPANIFFGYRLSYNSSNTRVPAFAKSETAPVMHASDDDLHSPGNGWMDNFQDRLIFTNQAASIGALTTWARADGVTTFNGSTSAADQFELIDRGATVTTGRFVVRSRNPNEVRRIWTFDPISYLDNTNTLRWFGRLRRVALTASTTDYVGYYGYDINWNTNGTLTSAADSFGRQILFNYTDQLAGTVVRRRLLASISYKENAAATPALVAQFTESLFRLERITRFQLGFQTYVRFRYRGAFANCPNCDVLLTDVIVPGDNATATPLPDVPALADELTVEHHEFELPSASNTISTGSRPRVTGSSGISRRYAYEYGSQHNTQYDLNIDLGPCGGGCAIGACFSDGRCHAVNQRNTSSSLGMTTDSAWTSSSGGNGNGGTVFVGPAIPKAHTAQGITTSIGRDTLGRTRCIVRGDNDTEAFTTPTAPNTSTCAGPATAQKVQVDYAATTTTKTTASLIGGASANVVETQTVNAAGLPTITSTTGYTRDIDGTMHTEVHTSTVSYDALNRVIETNGPMPD
ncbi:MAG TPA: hypothetical protein PLF40_24145, partial [Kofleriaceae bacterium]|nr:hypothetical protein [Kofleriaceae bacterium]